MLNALRKLFFWNYARNTWQWDALCVVILIFIFLTPKSWFENSERRRLMSHQTPITSTFVVGAEVVENTKDRGQLEQRLRDFTGRPNARLMEVRKVIDKDGKITGYEVDIR